MDRKWPSSRASAQVRLAVDASAETGIGLGVQPAGDEVDFVYEEGALLVRDSYLDQARVCQPIPRQAAMVGIRHAEGVTTVEAGVLGRFSAEIVPLGQISLRCRLGTETDQSPVVTGWIAS